MRTKLSESAYDDWSSETVAEDPTQHKAMSDLYGRLLEAVGEDPSRPELLKTPDRAAEAMRFMTHGYDLDITTVINGAVYEEEADGIVIVRDIEFYSLCEHHLLPFFGKCHVGYLPDKRIIGLSKIPRIVDMFARRLQVQERMTRQVAEGLQEALNPHGVAVVTEAAHMCMMVRGVEKQHSSTISSCVRGAFRDDPTTRQEFFDLIRSSRLDAR